MRSDEVALRGDMVRLASRFGRYGYRQVTNLLRIEGWSVNHERVERLWRQEDSSDAFPDSSHHRVFGWNQSLVGGRIPLDRSFRAAGSDRHADTDPPTERCRYTGEEKR